MASKDETGRFFGLPYDWRRLNRDRLKRGIWNPDERRVLIPKVYGWATASTSMN